ncbi:MAG: AI-2E family transporter YdiK [Candidatus Dasytiphilus stammeri]
MCEDKHDRMTHLRSVMDIPQIVFLFMFISLLILTCFWVVRPFLPGFAWASMVVIATWPILIQIQNILWGQRILAVVVMIMLLFLLFIIPASLLIESFIDNIIPLIEYLSSGQIKLPPLHWLTSIPMIGEKLASIWKSILSGESSTMMTYIKPYVGKTTSFVFSQAAHVAHLMLHLILMIFFSILLYWRGEKIGNEVRQFARRLAPQQGETAVLLAIQAIRAVALGISVTALVQGLLGGIGLALFGIPYATLLTGILVLFCLMQLGTLPVLVPAIIWFYWEGDTTRGTSLVIWSCIIIAIDNVLRTVLIRMGADLPIILVIGGVIGGLLTFGMIGLFIGPVVLAISYRLIHAWMHELPASNH